MRQQEENLMKVFLTGANGFIGSTIIPELIHASHQVLGLTGCDAGAKSLTSAGAQVLRGSLEDLNSLRDGTGRSDAVIHCAYDTDLSNPEETNRKEAQAIEALGAELQGSDRP
jgi:nucleoside-diphosphate-sugar epimerase